MIGTFQDIFWFLFAFVGMVMAVAVWLPSRSVTRRRAYSIIGTGAFMVGLVMFINLYMIRHVESDGVIFIPSPLMNIMLTIGIVLLVFGALVRFVQVRRTRPKSESAHDLHGGLEDLPEGLIGEQQRTPAGV
jgi:vacuolar-type H+-ATPase subunit I/STV1